MGKRTGKKNVSFLFRKSRSLRRTEPLPLIASGVATETRAAKAAKKKSGSRLWMRFDRTGKSEMIELDKSAIIRMASIPARDLRILGPIFSHSSNIVAREKAMIVNLESIKAVITADEVLLLDPLLHEVLPFIEQLRQKIHLNSPFKEILSTGEGEQWMRKEGKGEQELPFEFQVLEISLEFVCTCLDSRASDLEREAYPALDELAKSVSTNNLERVRSLKSNLTRLLARVQKVRDEIEHLLDDDEDLRQLCLTRKQIQNQQFEALMASTASNSLVFAAAPNMTSLSCKVRRSASLASVYSDDNNVENLEMLLEAYFMQLEGTRNKILSVREYIDDTEDYVNIELDHQRNELIQLQLVLSCASFGIAINTLMVGAVAMNIPCPLYNTTHLFGRFVGGTIGVSFLSFFLLVAYARWKKLLGS